MDRRIIKSRKRFGQKSLWALLAITLFLPSGCATTSTSSVRRPAGNLHVRVPREMAKTVLPEYRIEAPDILLIDVVRLIPRSPYYVRPYDVLEVEAIGTLPDHPIAGSFVVDPGGNIELGYPYGSVRVADLTIKQIADLLQSELEEQTKLKDPHVTVRLLEISTMQQISGEHLVGPDGKVTLGVYGSIYVHGLTVQEAREAIESHLSNYLDDPQVAVDVFAYNSKEYYVILEGAGLGDRVIPFPYMGNETVLKAIANVQGLEQVSSKKIWIARPNGHQGQPIILPVDWQGITAHACPQTNYQIMPNDRVFVAEDKLIAFDTYIGKLTAPIERVMGFTLLGTGTVTRLSGDVLGGGGNPSSNF